MSVPEGMTTGVWEVKWKCHVVWPASPSDQPTAGALENGGFTQTGLHRRYAC